MTAPDEQVMEIRDRIAADYERATEDLRRDLAVARQEIEVLRAQVLAEAGAERERIAALADEDGATFMEPCTYGTCPSDCQEHPASFGDFIRSLPGYRCEGCGTPSASRFCSTACAQGENPERAY